ncbi:hypothetical protein GF406_21005 [candidate division KSB1 bacterium]|nr:hypothetical protein [candidate division KSB1 bacterium]
MNRLCILLLFFASVLAQPRAHLPFQAISAVVADNDDHRDVYTDEYLMLCSHLGEFRLLGLVTSYAANAREYDMFVQGRQDMVDMARKCGLQNVPAALAGAGVRLQRPESNRIEDTRALALPASHWLVEQARHAFVDTPLVVVTGGPLTTVADAYLIDPSIAEKIVVSGVFGVREIDYNAGLDAWAWTIVLSKFRVLGIPIGPPKARGKVYMKPPYVPKSRLQKEFKNGCDFFQWMIDKHHPSNTLPDEHDYDGQAAIPLLQPQYITDVARFRVEAIDDKGRPRLIPDPKGSVYEALDANQDLATAEFWRVMAKVRE